MAESFAPPLGSNDTLKTGPKIDIGPLLAVRPDMTRPWYVRVLDSTGFKLPRRPEMRIWRKIRSREQHLSNKAIVIMIMIVIMIIILMLILILIIVNVLLIV